MSNPNNCVILSGNLAAAPTIFTNRDGSKTVLSTIYTKNNYKNRDGSVGSQKVTVKDYIPAGRNGNGAYDYMGEGDRVNFSASVDTENYTDRSGKVVYETVLLVDSVSLQTSRRESQNRAAAKAQGQAPAPAAPAQAQQAPAAPQAPVQGGFQAQAAPAQAPVAPQAPAPQAQTPAQVFGA